MDKDFGEFLSKTPEALGKFVSVLKEFYELQQKYVDIGPPESEPEKFVIGGSPKFEFNGLSLKDLDAISKGTAEAHVKEKAVEWIKGLFIGVSWFA